MLLQSLLFGLSAVHVSLISVQIYLVEYLELHDESAA